MSISALRRRRIVVGGVTPAVGIALSASARTVVRSNTTTLTVTLTRTSFTSDVTLAVAGLPSGVTGAFSVNPLAGATLVSVLTLTATAAATLVDNDAFTITASGSVVSDAVQNATVSVVVAGSWAPNLPAGMTLHIETGSDGFAPVSDTPNAEDFRAFWSFENQTDMTAPYPGGIFATIYPGNHAGDGGGGAVTATDLPANTTELYFSLMARFVGSGGDPYATHTNGEKFFYPTIGAANQSQLATAMNFTVHSTANGPEMAFAFNSQMNGGPATWLIYYTEGARVVKNEWSMIEMYCKLNTPGNSDGIWNVWVNGVPATANTDMVYSNHPVQSHFLGRLFDGTRGGGTSSVLTPPGGQQRHYNRLTLYTRST